MHPTLTEQQLEELRPLAAVIEGAIKDTPIRLGTDDWGTVLAATVLARVAAYMGGVVRPVASGPAADEDAQRATRRASLGHLLGRAERGALVSPKEGALLRQHVETEMREADTAREDRQRLGLMVDEYSAGARHLGDTLRTEKERADAAIERETVLEGEIEAQEAAIERVRALADQWDNALAPAKSQYSGPVRAALDGTEQPTTTEA